MKKKEITEQNSSVKVKIVPGQDAKGKAYTWGPRRYSSRHKSHIINPVDLHTRIKKSKYLKTSAPASRQYGHPDVVEVVEEAARRLWDEHLKGPEDAKPKISIKDISASDDLISMMCRGKKDDPETPDYDERRAGCKFGGHVSHVTGLDFDVCFIYEEKTGTEGGVKYNSYNLSNPSGIKNMAPIENLYFLKALSENEKVNMIIVSKHVYSQLKKRRDEYVERYENLLNSVETGEKKVPNFIKSTGIYGGLTEEEITNRFKNNLKEFIKKIKGLNPTKINADGDGKTARSGHWRHFHVRLEIPSEDTVTKTNTTKPEKIKSPDDQTLKSQELFLRKNLSYTFGTVEGEILTGPTGKPTAFNENYSIGGASMQKLPALLVNLSVYDSESKQRLTAEEMALLLTYQKAKREIAGGNMGPYVPKSPSTQSNFIMRYISGTKPGWYDIKDANGKKTGRRGIWSVYTGNRRIKDMPNLPIIKKSEFKEWSKKVKFGKSSIGGRLGVGGNKQTTIDMFNLLSTIYTSSMDDGNPPIRQEDAKLVLALLDRDESYFKQNYNKKEGFFKRGQKTKGFDREIYGIRENKTGSLKVLAENYLQEKGHNVKIDKIYGKGGWFRTLNYGVYVEFQGKKYIFVCYTKRQLFGGKQQNHEFIGKLLGKLLLQQIK
tara:strand:+ start:2617 stop:4599 length:1983 start_codon:yes stop_codon:yes gene_type:complete